MNSRRHIPTMFGNSQMWPQCAVLVVSAALSLLLVGCDTQSEVRAGTTPPPNPASASAPVRVDRPDPGAISDEHDPAKYTTTGPLVAEQQADLAAEVDGRVAEIRVQVGDRVRKGQLLAQLDDRIAQANCEAQKAKLASLEAQVHEWESEQKTEEADLRRADIMRAEHIRSEEDWEHVKYKLDETIAAVARYRAERDAAKANLQLAILTLGQTRILAPFDGVIGRSQIRLAQEVKKGDVLFWITAERPLHIVFTVPEQLMASFHTGSRLELTTADYPQLREKARILRVSPVVDPASGSIQVIGLVQNGSHSLKPGMTMQVRLQP